MRRAIAALAACALLSAPAAAQMPDPRQMSGVPLPVSTLEVGTVSVRVVKGAITNPVVNHPVVLTGVGAPMVAQTDAQGRATFTGLTPGARVRGETTVDGEKLASQDFAVPPTGGIRLMLVATDPGQAAAAEDGRKMAQAPAQPGTVAFGEESRFVIELGEDGLNVFSILQIVNAAPAPVQPQTPIVFDLPQAAERASILEGSSPQARAAGKRVTVDGPFAPGATLVQFAYTIPYGRGDLTFEQKLPAALSQLNVIVQKIGGMHVTSPQLAQHRDMATEGQTYILGRGPGLQAGDTVTLHLTGLPHEPTWPRNVALALAGAILAAGAWFSVRRRPTPPADAARRLHARRDGLLGELAKLEEDHRRGAVAVEPYQERRRDLVAALEQVYAQIDEEAAA